MKLISKVVISGFRSIKEAELNDIGHFSVLAGLNNSGKSNFLRALNAFFNGHTDIDMPLSIDEDYYRQEIKRRKKKKKISICVNFQLPGQFKIPKRIENVNELLGGREFSIKKEWVREETMPRIYLNTSNSTTPLNIEDRQKIEQFLSLISFRYVPNRVLPTEVIKKEHRALRDVLVRRLGRKSKGSDKAFEDIKETSERIISSLSMHFRTICPDIENIRLITPTSWAEMVFAFGYKLQDRGVEIDDSAQGAGIQSLLMFQTLLLIDRDYFQKFGWRQAAIWAVEEPESSLHSLLEAYTSSFLSEIARQESGRLQIFTTSHSDVVIQYADKCYYVEKGDDGSKATPHGAREALEKTAKEGISRLGHSLLYQPTKPLLLVEGKYDKEFLRNAVRLLGSGDTINILCLEDLPGSGASGGIDNLKSYIKRNKKTIEVRPTTVIVVLDWDARSRENEFKKIVEAGYPYKVLVWPEGKWNPKLGRTFKGIERYFSDRLIQEVENQDADLLSRNRTGIASVDPSDYDRVKRILAEIVKEGLREEDLEFCKEFLNTILNEVE